MEQGVGRRIEAAKDCGFGIGRYFEKGPGRVTALVDLGALDSQGAKEAGEHIDVNKEQAYNLAFEIKEQLDQHPEKFIELAREYSDSETRLRDGFVGRITEGDLPARLEEIAFGSAPVGGGEPALIIGRVEIGDAGYRSISFPVETAVAWGYSKSSFARRWWQS